MSLNSSNQPDKVEVVSATSPTPVSQRVVIPMRRRVLLSVAFPVWVFLGFMLAQALILALIAVLQALGVSFDSFNATIFNAVGGAVIYGLAILLVLGVPWVVKRRKTSLEELGLSRLPSWKDFAWTPLAMVGYLILTTIVMQIAVQLLTFVNYEQVQQTGFSEIASQPEYILAFISLVVIAPVAEEILFRGYLLGKLRKYAPLWVSILITSALFAAVHFQWNVAIDVFVLSIVLCLLRVWTGSLWTSIFLHMLKNGVAYYFLFINPSLLSTMG